MEDSLLIVFYITGHGLGECALSWPRHSHIHDSGHCQHSTMSCAQVMPPERSRSPSTLHRLAIQLWLSAVRLQRSSSRRSNRQGGSAFGIEADMLLSASLI